MNPVRLQRVSAAIFGVFLIVHLAAALALIFGGPAYDRALELTRSLYGHLAVEIVLAAAALTHVAASLVLWRRRPAGASRPLFATVHTLSGFAILVLLGGHILFTRLAPASFDFQATFLYVWTSTTIWPTLFVPYYAFLFSVGATHLTYGLRRLLKRPVRAGAPLWAAYGLYAVLGIAISAGVLVHRPTVEPTDAQLAKFLKPYETFTPWLIDMADQHPFIVRHRSQHGAP